MKLYLSSLLLAYAMLGFSLTAQNTSQKQSGVLIKDGRSYAISPQEMIQVHLGKQADNNRYLTGREYKLYYSAGYPNPFLNSKSGVGDVFIQGVGYKGISLIYDVNTDELIVSSTKSYPYIQVEKALVDSFNITFRNDKYTFTNLHFEGVDTTVMKNGYYEVLDSGEITCLLQHTSKITYKDSHKVYNLGVQRFLKKNSSYYIINKKKEFIALFPKQVKSIKGKLNSYGCSYQLLSNYQLIDLVRYAQSLQ